MEARFGKFGPKIEKVGALTLCDDEAVKGVLAAMCRSRRSAWMQKRPMGFQKYIAYLGGTQLRKPIDSSEDGEEGPDRVMVAGFTEEESSPPDRF